MKRFKFVILVKNENSRSVRIYSAGDNPRQTCQITDASRPSEGLPAGTCCRKRSPRMVYSMDPALLVPLRMNGNIVGLFRCSSPTD